MVERVEGRSTINASRYLVYAIIVLVILVLVFLGLLIRLIFFSKPVPRTADERDFYYFQEMIKAHPKVMSNYTRFIEAAIAINRLQEAEEAIKKAMKLKPKYPFLNYYLAQIYYRQGKKTDCEKYLLKEIKISSNPFAYYDLARLAKEKGDRKKCIEYLKSALKENYYWGDAHLFLAQIYEEEGNKEAAIKEYKEVLKFIPDDKDALEGLRRLEGSSK